MRALHLLPYQRIDVHSGRSPEELIGALKGITQPPSSLSALGQLRPGHTATFIGEVSPQRLYIRLVPRGRNSFAPYLSGRIVPAPFGARIEAVLRPHLAALAFLALLAFALFPAVIIALVEFLGRGILELPGLVPVAIFASLYPMCMLGFAPEARRMKAHLREIAGPDIAALMPR